jgi:type VI secretion system protein VasG
MAIMRKNLFGKLNSTLFKTIEGATTFCKLRGNPYVELVHWLYQLWHQEDNDLKHIVRHFSLNFEMVEHELSQALTQLPTGATSISDFSYHIELATERAWVCASLEYFDSRIRSGHLLLAILMSSELRRALVSILPSFSKIALDELSEQLGFITRESPENHESEDKHYPVTSHGLPGEASQAMNPGVSASLAQYTTDLTALAREGKMDPVLGRDHEIRTLTDILLRRRQNNPLLTGEAGVGKTAVVEGLAQAIVANQVPPALRLVRLLALDVVALSAGASMKGEFEARLKAVLDEAMSSVDPVVLFIDEVHTLVGAGGTAGTGDAANLLKPALARGQLRTIGATTWSEFKRHIEKDPALTRRFQVLQVDEPDEIAAMAMLRGLVPALETHHKVWVTDEAIEAAVRFSHRYIPARQLPDKAISLLDTACARIAVAQHTQPSELQKNLWLMTQAKSELSALEKAADFGHPDPQRMQKLQCDIEQYTLVAEQLQTRWQAERDIVEAICLARQQIAALNGDDDNQKAQRVSLQQKLSDQETSLLHVREGKCFVQAEVNGEVIARIVADWTGIPVGQVLKDDANAVLQLPQCLNQRVVGQQRALEQLSDNIITARAGLADPRKPLGVFMLVGPSGVGKTETALAIAESIYAGEHNLITINMSEYQEAHTISSLKGSPPGYVGYGEGGVLTEAVRRKPYSVILLDEIEKAHSDVHELFYQVFDKGQMEDGEGRVIDFKNTIILLTSNVGSDLITHLCADAETIPDNDGLLSVLHPELSKIFPAAFLGRVTVIPYFPLQENALRRIVAIHLERVAERLHSQHGIKVKYRKPVVEAIISQCRADESGARLIIRYIERCITPLIGKFIFNRSDELKGGTLSLQKDDKGFHVTLSRR